jgi:tetratricopeptide (TPR) repeat protein
MEHPQFRTGLALHQQGQLLRAEQIYTSILQADPADFDALHMLGVVALQTNRLPMALDLLQRAVVRSPRAYPAHSNLAHAQRLAGRPSDALASIEKVVRLKPDFAEAHLNRGNLLRELGRAKDALAAYGKAIALNPGYAEAHANRGLLLAELGRLPEALSSLDRATELRPADAQAQYARGIVLKDLHRPQDALAALDAAIAITPDIAPFHTERGIVLAQLGRLEDAIASQDRALALEPGSVSARYNRTTARRDLGQLDAALADTDQALAASSDPMLHNLRSDILLRLARPAEAVEALDAAIALAPDNAELWSNRATSREALVRFDDALSDCDHALALNPRLAAAHACRANVLRRLGRLEDALSACDAALALTPSDAALHANRAIALAELKRPADALNACVASLTLDPGHAPAHFTRASVLLKSGDYAEGWRELEWRKRLPAKAGQRDFAQPEWRGETELTGRTIFLHWEQGFGDTIQFLRYVPLVARLAGKIVLSVQAPLQRLAARLDPAIQVLAEASVPGSFDCHCPLMSLPLALGIPIPSDTPYLHADPTAASHWRQRLAALPGTKIGLVWAGARNPGLETEFMFQRRSLALAALAPLANMQDVSFISLQKGPQAEQARTPPTGMTLHDWTDELSDFDDTAALISGLDLVISVDTAVAHLAGALGKPVWLLNRYDTDWRWMEDRTDSPWYPTMRIFRQPANQDWNTPITEIAARKIFFFF